MTLNDFLRRVSKEKDGDKMMIYKDCDGGWTNIHIEITDNEIIIKDEDNLIFSSDK